VKSSWVEGYYEALEFFYWEPQHLGRKKHEASRFKTLKEVQDHLRLMEVTLNHQIKQFFALAPKSFRNRLFGRALKTTVSGEFVLVGSELDREYSLSNATQPDFLFTAPDATVSVEMKIEAKSNVSQVLKYALLGLAVEQQDKCRRKHHLIFLGVGGFGDLWKERFRSLGELKQVLETKKESFLDGRPERLRAERARYEEIVSTLSIGFLSYGAFADLLRTERDSLDDSMGAQVYRNLIDGMLHELNERKILHTC